MAFTILTSTSGVKQGLFLLLLLQITCKQTLTAGCQCCGFEPCKVPFALIHCRWKNKYTSRSVSDTAPLWPGFKTTGNLGGEVVGSRFKPGLRPSFFQKRLNIWLQTKVSVRGWQQPVGVQDWHVEESCFRSWCGQSPLIASGVKGREATADGYALNVASSSCHIIKLLGCKQPYLAIIASTLFSCPGRCSEQVQKRKYSLNVVQWQIIGLLLDLFYFFGMTSFLSRHRNNPTLHKSLKLHHQFSRRKRKKKCLHISSAEPRSNDCR